MATKALAKYIRISPQKARLVADQIRGLPVDKAIDLLRFSGKKSAGIIKKVLESAIANAEHNDGADIDELKVVAVHVDAGSIFREVQGARTRSCRTNTETHQSRHGVGWRGRVEHLWARKCIRLEFD